MIKLLCEDLENNFEFDMVLPITIKVKELFYNEDWKINKDWFDLSSKASGPMMKDIRNLVDNYVETNTVPTLLNLLQKSEGAYTLIQDNGKPFKHGKLSKENGVLSYACYFLITCNVSNIKCSQSVQDSIGSFKIRLANHISAQEQKSISDYGNTKLFVEDINDLYQKLFEDYTNNILTTYTNFLKTLSTYPNKIETFNDINPKDISKLKEISIQGLGKPNV